MKIAIICAIGKNGELGKEGKLPWNIPEDLRHFKNVTIGNTVVFGRKTFDTLPRKLGDRDIIVLTTKTDYVAEDAKVMHSVADVIEYAYEKDLETLYIAGGGEIYKHFLPLASQAYITRVHHSFDADAFFPPKLSISEWEMKQVDHRENDNYKYSFEYYERRTGV